MRCIVKKVRPRVLGGLTVKVPTVCGSMYVQMNWYRGKLFEVFATLGHGGGCASSQSEGITRSVTLGLRCGVPYDDYAKQLQGIRCPSPMPFPKERAILSCPDAIGKVIKEFGGKSAEELLAVLRGIFADSTKDAQGEDDADVAAAQAHIQELAEERERQGL